VSKATGGVKRLFAPGRRRTCAHGGAASAIAALLAACQPYPSGAQTLATRQATETEIHDQELQATVATTKQTVQLPEDRDTPRTTLLGQFDPTTNDGLAIVPKLYASRSGMYAERATLAAFKKMHAAAAREGVRLVVVSAFRSFSDQKRIWENKWSGRTLVSGLQLSEALPDPQLRALKILEFSSMPGTSRHHWGTDLDLNSVDVAYFKTTEGHRVYKWLEEHAPKFGFCQTYSADRTKRPDGYGEEPWHWSYLPVASSYLTRYLATISYPDIIGFSGSDTAKAVDVIARYVEGISPACKS